ncbi:MAG: ABC transporter substrate-binding protein [Bacteroidetes bacterium]|nr:ABC transporter substrate-binding protein [Bacteroidota bacterium]
MVRMMAVFMVVVLVLAAVSGCRRSAIPEHHVRMAKGGKAYGGTYRINMLRGSPSALDPVRVSSKLADDICLQIFDRLITFDSLLGVQGELATRWEISEDGTEYVFHLRTDVRFHDDVCFPQGRGRRLTAHDMVYSLVRACDPTQKTLSFWAFQDRVLGASRFHRDRELGRATRPPEGIVAPDDSTLVITLERPFAPFLLTLASGFGCAVPHEAVEHYGEEFFRHPVGSGPFMFREWREDQQITLVRNPNYWQHDEAGNRLPFLDGVRIEFIKDDNVQFAAFKQGLLEECFTIPTEVFPLLVDASTGNLRAPSSAFALQRTPALCTWFVDCLCTEAPFNDRRVRRALSMSIDRHRLVKFVLQGQPFAAATHGITPPVLLDYPIDSVRGLGFDPDRARAELAQAGFPNGRGFPEVTLTIYSEPRLKQTAEALQQMWREQLGITMKIRVLQFAQFLQEAEAGRLQLWGTRWYGDYPDAETFLGLFNGAVVPTDPHGASYPNSTRYNDPTVTQYLMAGVGEPDRERRHTMYRKAESLVAEDSPALLLFYEMHYRLLQSYVRDTPLDPMARVVLKHTWFAS